MNLEELRDELKPLKDDLHLVKEGLFDPDKGLFTRVKKNTSWRKTHQRIYWLLLGGLILTSLQYIITKFI